MPSNQSRNQRQNEIVSSEQEPLILVDEHDRAIGQLDKAACHDGAGVRHRAFSVFLFDRDGALLMQQRAAGKRLWPGYWSNSCCSHPRVGETLDEAVVRRVEQELGLVTRPEFVYKFEYVAHFGTLGTEHELCSVYLGRASRDPAINANEISAWRWIGAAALDHELETTPEAFTPWFRLEWQRLRGEFSERLAALGVPPSQSRTRQEPAV